MHDFGLHLSMRLANAAGRLCWYFVCLFACSFFCVLLVSCFASVMGFSQIHARISPR